jgi:RHS repeat-associated protein
VTNPFGVAGGVLDSSALIKFGMRYYDPAIARWTQEDSQAGPNLYSYVDGNPINSVDISGAFVPLLILLLIAVVVVAIIYVAQDASDESDWNYEPFREHPNLFTTPTPCPYGPYPISSGPQLRPGC